MFIGQVQSLEARCAAQAERGAANTAAAAASTMAAVAEGGRRHAEAGDTWALAYTQIIIT